MADNAVIIAGNTTRAPELRYTPSGQATASFGVAHNRRWQNKQTQEWQEQTSFLDVVCWQKLAEGVAEAIKKGDRVLVTGRLEQQSWEDKETGAKRSKVLIVADDVALSMKFAGSGERTAAPGPAATTYANNEEPF